MLNEEYQIDLSIDQTVLSIDQTVLSIDQTALSIDLTVLSIDPMTLSIDQVALSLVGMALNMDPMVSDAAVFRFRKVGPRERARRSLKTTHAFRSDDFLAGRPEAKQAR